MNDREQAIREVLRSLGVSDSYKGVCYMAEAVNTILEKEDRLENASVRIFPAIAKRHGLTASGLQRNLRTVVDVSWREENRAALERLAGRSLVRKPTLLEFIDLLAASFLRVGC